ncbi:hypothetical protein Cpir12675_006408 [Ceratocystis pirilliformis]|uniref:Rhodopsin domain-containing protein n=1 Tax=Ceratocystis pirilliformis TaxID=259994 RepID=A0ABR3YHX5_9PEZI
MRIFTGQFRKITIICMIVIGMWSTSIWLVTINTCTPVRAYWDKSIEGRCIPNLPLWYINAAGNILTDLVIVVLPVKVLWNLHLPKSQRLSLIGVFALGFFTCAISLIRVFALSLDSDLSYKNIDAAIWSFAELACALISSSLPTLRPIMYRILPRIFHPSIRSSGRKTTRGSEYARYGLKSNSTTPEDESSLTKPHTSTEKLASDTSDVELQVRSGDRRACLTTICAGQDSNSANSVPLGGINVRTETYIEDARL